MIYFILLGLLILPLIIKIIFATIWQAEIRLSTYYILEAIIVGVLSLVGHAYYYFTYDLNILPMADYMKFFLGISVVIVIVMFIAEVFKHLFKKEGMMSFKGSILIFVGLAIFFLWLIPLGQKYYYADRLDKMETIFENQPKGKVIQEDEIEIALVASEYDKVMRPRFRKPGAYNNYVYLRNNNDNPFSGHMYLTLKNENEQAVDIKLIDIDVPANATELIAIPEDNKLMSGEWDQRSFKSKQQGESIETTVVADD